MRSSIVILGILVLLISSCSKEEGVIRQDCYCAEGVVYQEGDICKEVCEQIL